ncbi:MAG: efflux RND transporter periplasmic adaptor subunit [Gammaproteobacteria bacterium]|nr:efflux RND transporter periplasmic adaptor subunit [Gammaproteobacteria bacterium]
MLQGYIEGEYTYISSSVSGTLFSLNVSRGQQINKNQLLFTLDPQPDQAVMEAAQATVEQLQAQVSLANIQWIRQQKLYVKNATDKASLDEAATTYTSNVKQLQNAKATLTKEQWAFQQKTIYAPISGYVNDTFYRIGEKVTANQPVLSILCSENIKVLFYIPETQLSTIHLGQHIVFTCDGCKKSTSATITYISSEAEYTPPIIYSKDTRYKLVYLVRAQMPKNIAYQFHPGQPVDISLDE